MNKFYHLCTQIKCDKKIAIWKQVAIFYLDYKSSKIFVIMILIAFNYLLSKNVKFGKFTIIILYIIFNIAYNTIVAISYRGESYGKKSTKY